MLGKPGNMDCLMLRSPTRKMVRNNKMVYSFAFFLIYAYLLMLFELFKNISKSVMILINFEAFLSIAFFIIVYLREPGYLEKDIDFIKLLEIYDDLS